MSTKLTKLAADFTTQLASTTEATGTTGSIQGFTDDDGVALPAGDYVFAVDTDNSEKEYWRATLGSDGALTGIKTLTRQGVETSGSARKHRAGATVKITDWAQLKYITDLLSGATDLDASDPLKYDAAPSFTTGSNELATVKFAEDQANAGAATASTVQAGISEEATQAEIDADTAAGATTKRLFVNPSTLVTSKYGTRLPTADEKAALDGTGTPSTSNKFVTEDTLTTGLALKSAVADIQSFTSSGTWTKPSNAERVLVQAWGGGGGGGRAATSADRGAGGGGGAYIERWLTASDLGSTETVTIGAAGAGATSDGTSGANGGDTTFGAHITAYGGSGGQGAGASPVTGGHGGGHYGIGSPSAPHSGQGVSNSAGTIGEYSGGGGANAGAGGNSVWGGAGGGGASNGTGGTSKYGGNGGAGNASGAGTAGTEPAGGGGGALGGNGGAGAKGRVLVTTFF